MSLFPPASTTNSPSTGLADYNRDAGGGPEPSAGQEADQVFEVGEAEEQEAETTNQPNRTNGEEEVGEEGQNVGADQEPEETEQRQAPGRADKRIRQLVGEKKRQEEENASLRATLQALQEHMREQVALGREQWNAQRPFVEQQRTQQGKTEKRQKMLELGFDPADYKDHALYDALQENVQMRSELGEVRKMFEETKHEKQMRAYSEDLSRRITAELEGYDVSSEHLANIQEQAIESAVAKGLDSAQAAATVATRVKPFLRKRSATTKPKPTGGDVHGVISTSGRSGGEGTSRAKPSTFDEALKSLFG